MGDVGGCGVEREVEGRLRRCGGSCTGEEGGREERRAETKRRARWWT
jgi:hypothetical protein